MAKRIELEINGKRYPVDYPADTALLYVLRDELGLTGSKYGCGEGQCGACTVLIGGAPRRSCQIPVSAVAAKPITTIEGLEKDGRLNPVQQAFLDAGAFQCAYCTSGMIMSSVGLLQTNPNPSRAEIVQFLQGNVCRCGTPGGQDDAGARAMSEPSGKFVLEPERYEFAAAPMHQFELARRDFFKLIGAGIAVFAIANDATAEQETAPGHRSFHNEEWPKDINAWLHIGEDGTVTGFTGKAEIGQNARTELAQTIADELRVPFESVRMVMADTALTPFDAGTFGSRTTPTITPQLRRVSAAARDILVEAAAKNWNVAPEGLVAADARVSDPASGRSLKYAELARGKTLAQNLPAEDPVAPASQWTIAGRAIPKVDGRAFVTGRHQYTPDLRPAGMLYGKVLRPPSFGATLTAYDDSAAKAMTGVFVVRDGEFVGAAAPSADEAQSALDAIHAQWKEVPQIANKEIFSYLKQNAVAKTDDRFRKQ